MNVPNAFNKNSKYSLPETTKENVNQGNPQKNTEITYSLTVNIKGTKKIIGIFFPNFKIIVKIKLKINDNKIINNKKTKKKFFVS